MREAQLYAMHEASARRMQLLFQQVEFLKTRQEAFERMIKVTTVWQKLKFAFFPEHFFLVWNAVHTNLLNEAKAQMEALQAKPKIEVVPSL